jgi:hypothetical protein
MHIAQSAECRAQSKNLTLSPALPAIALAKAGDLSPAKKATLSDGFIPVN